MAPREPLWIGTGASYSPEEDRLLLSNLLKAPRATYTPSTTLGNRPGVGIAREGDLLVTQDGTPGMRVLVASGSAFVAGSQSSEQGVYAVRNDAAYVVNLAAADAVNRRNDIIVARIQDADYSGAVRSFTVEVKQGANYAGAHNNANDPTLDPNSLPLARVQVAPGDTSITNAEITDLRQFVPMAGRRRGSAAARLLAINVEAGEEWYETDTGRLFAYHAAAWVPIPTGRRMTSGVSSATTDASGNLVVAHGLGATPNAVIMSLGPGNSLAVIQVAKLARGGTDATNFAVYVHRTDTNTFLATTQVFIDWVATV
jgi:hypothetical protein